MEENKKSHGTVVIVILSILLILVSGYVVYDKLSKSNNKSNNQVEKKSSETVEKLEPVAALSDESENFILLNENFEKIYEYKIKTPNSAKFNLIKVDGNYLYYAEGDTLYRLNITTMKSESLDIKMDKYWNFNVSGNDLVYSNVDEVNYVNINDKKTTKLDIKSNNKEALINGVFYYTKKDNNSLVAYDLKTNKENSIATKARIVINDKNSIIYAEETTNSAEKFILYNVVTGIKKELTVENLSGNEFFVGALFNDKAYVFRNNILTVTDVSSKNELYKYKSTGDYSKNYNEEIKNAIMLSDNKLLLVALYYDAEKPCESDSDDICTPNIVEKRSMLVDIKNNKVTRIEKDIDFLYDSSFELYRLYK